jgi:hypothetical protein
VATKPATAAIVGSTVLCVAYMARAMRLVRLSSGIEAVNTASTSVVRETSSESNWPPPRTVLMTNPPTTRSPSAAPVDKVPIVAKLMPKTRAKPRLSPAANAADMAGNAAMAKLIPMRLTGSAWKLLP